MVTLAEYINAASKDELKLILAGVEKKLAEKGAPMPGRPPAGAAFSVPQSTKHLTAEQLDTATQAFAEWCEEAKNSVQKRSRNRLRLAFLLMRFGAMRLGEVLAVDDRTDILASRYQVAVRGSNARRVLLPKNVMQEIVRLVSSPMFYSLRGQIFQLDPGYLRRKFYERAKACGLPGKLFNPRVIRHSRAIELLCGGVPLQVAQSFLGQQNLNMTANYLEFSGEAVQHIVQQYIARENKMKTSARNSFTGKVSGIRRDGLLVEVELTTMAGLQIVAIITEESFQNLRLAEGNIATATIKAPWVIVAHADDERPCSTRNRFSGTISEVKSTQVACEVVTDLADGTKVCALVSKESVEALKLQAGLEVQVMFKAFSVIINVD